MRASLMMYTRSETQAAADRYWTAIRAALARRGIDAPQAPERDGDPLSLWRAPDLLLSQTCGMPFRTLLHRDVRLIGTPDYALPCCAPGYYRSVIVVRAADSRTRLSDFADGTLAYNDPLSQSGVAALHAHVAPMGFWFDRRVCSGAHEASARMVADGTADIAAVDAQTWRLMRRHAPFTRNLRVIDQTAPTPGLPYITGLQQDAGAIFDAVAEAISGLSPQDAHTLCLRAILRIPAADYLAIPNPPEGILD